MRPEFRILLAGVLVAIFATTTGLQAADKLPRVASVNICGDQFLMMLADPSQIASLSWHATSHLSYHAAKAATFARNHATAEEILVQDVDIVIAADYGDQQLKKILKRFNIRIVELPLSEDFADVEETVLSMSKEIGRAEQGEALVREMKERLQRIEASIDPEKEQRKVLYFRSDGGGAGSRTFVNTAIEVAGFRNLQAELGDTSWRTLPFERVVMAPPDVLVTSFFDSPYASIGSAFRYHPTFWKIAQDRSLIQVPGKLWPCASPLLVNAAEHLSVARERLGERSAGTMQ
ncbi:MAG: ABC transporter substrate-binding protein [Parvibaculum sp.]